MTKYDDIKKIRLRTNARNQEWVLLPRECVNQSTCIPENTPTATA